MEINSSIVIGTQIWMTTNLNVDQFQNGDKIPTIVNSDEWIDYCKAEKPACCFYDNNSELGNSLGRLYNFYAVADKRNLAPEGWHIPDVQEWLTLLKHPHAQTMNIVLGGRRNCYERTSFQDINNGGYWWTSTKSEKSTKIDLYGVAFLIRPFIHDKVFLDNSASLGFSVMCIKNDSFYLEKEAAKAIIPYKIHDIGPSGGYIFYDKGIVSDSWRYLEASPEGWHGGKYELTANWGSYGIKIGGTGSDVGRGKSNTAKILETTNEKGIAARLCNEATINGFRDWFLPSKMELNLMYENLHKKGYSKFDELDYWSSTENGADYAYYQGFHWGGQKEINKNNPFRVRPIRAF